MDIDRNQAIVLGASFLIAIAIIGGTLWYTGYLGNITSYIPFMGGESEEEGGEEEVPEFDCEWPEIPDSDGCCIDENNNGFCDYLDEFAGKEAEKPVTPSPTTTVAETETTTQVAETITTAPQTETTLAGETTSSTPTPTQSTTPTSITTTTSSPPITTTIATVESGVELVFKADAPIIPLYTDSQGFMLTIINIGEDEAKRVQVMALLPNKRVLQSMPVTFDLGAGKSRNVTVNVRPGMIADSQFILFTAETGQKERFSQWLQVDVRNENSATGEMREKGLL
ncbi:MAG: hypothetical protein ABH950_09000 [Candidatus Altiarchaeota archaeon]